MKKRFLAILCMILSAVFVFATACNKNSGGGDSDGDYNVEKEEGCNLLTIYYKSDSGYDDKDVWLWYGSVNGTGYKFHSCEYGGKAMFNIPEEIEEVGFIIRKNCVPGSSSWGNAQKDGTDADRTINMKGKGDVEIYTKSGDGKNYSSTDGGVTLEEMKFLALADMTDLTHIKITASNNENITKDRVKVTTASETGAAVEVGVASVSKNIVTMASPLELSKAYTLEVEGFDDPVGVVPATYFQSKEFEQAYTYDRELGVELQENKTIFRLWAPTASSVDLNLYGDGSFGKAKVYPMERGEKGVWTYTADSNLNGKYYTYTVATSAGVNEAVDPYARSAGLNGKRGMILDLDKTDPENWAYETFVNNGVDNYTDAQIWEVHIRDFSNKISSLKEEYRGKYLGFTVDGLKNKNGISVGLAYLKELGITHVHLLPSYDYSSVDESAIDESFNWGYDPENYNVPEGSYSTDPYDGAVRVNEYKQMVQALHNAGIGVIMDVVYNHTYSIDSNLNKVVPYYYYRYGSDGNPSNGSGCGNETASERSMVRKYIVDSVSYWQNEYKLDGFRFDLMGVHDITTMQEIEKTVHAANEKAIIYGEGWTGGGVALDSKEQATLANLQKLNTGAGVNKDGLNGVAMFNDVIRDGIKGSTFNLDDRGYATGGGATYIENVLFGVTGSTYGGGRDKFTNYTGNWSAANPTQVINYVSAHDNNTLWDRICHIYGEGNETLGKRLAMNRLSAAIVQTSLGIPFMQAGEEMLRAKKNEDGSYNENSYNAPDSVNNIDWDLLTTESEQYKMMQYYKGLIQFRKANKILRQTTVGDYETGNVCKLVKKEGAFVAFTMTHTVSGEKLLVIYNPTESEKDFKLPKGSWDLYINGTTAGVTKLASAAGESTVKIAGISCYVYKQA